MFTVWLPTAYSANMPAQNSKWTAISALRPEYGRWPTVIMCSADSHLCIISGLIPPPTCTYMHSMVPAYYTHSPNPPRKIETTSVTVRDNEDL